MIANLFTRNLTDRNVAYFHCEGLVQTWSVRIHCDPFMGRTCASDIARLTNEPFLETLRESSPKITFRLPFKQQKLQIKINQSHEPRLRS